MMRRCARVSPRGIRCRQWAMQESEFCYQHSPDTKERRLETAGAAGKRRIGYKSCRKCMFMHRPDDPCVVPGKAREGGR